MIGQGELHDRIAKDLAPHGWAPATRSAEDDPVRPGWRVFMPMGLGEARLMWAQPGDYERAQVRKGKGRDLDDAAMRLANITAIHDVLVGLGYQGELVISLNDTPVFCITGVPA